MVLNYAGVFDNSLFLEIEGLWLNMNSETSYVFLTCVATAELYMYEIRERFFIAGVVAENSLSTAIENVQFNIEFETSYVSLA